MRRKTHRRNRRCSKKYLKRTYCKSRRFRGGRIGNLTQDEINALKTSTAREDNPDKRFVIDIQNLQRILREEILDAEQQVRDAALDQDIALTEQERVIRNHLSTRKDRSRSRKSYKAHERDYDDALQKLNMYSDILANCDRLLNPDDNYDATDLLQMLTDYRPHINNNEIRLAVSDIRNYIKNNIGDVPFE